MKGSAWDAPAASSVALITGGASGIGRALASELCGRGWTVVVADRQHELARTVATDLEARGGLAWAEPLDVRDLGEWEALGARLDERGVQVELLINNAGIAVGGEMAGYTPRDWDDVFDVNLRGVAYGVQTFYPAMVERNRGQVVNVASVAGLLTVAFQGSYSASKYAVVGLSKGLRTEAALHGVRVSLICPGVVRTPILDGGAFGRVIDKIPDALRERFWESMRPMDVDAFARRVVPRILDGEYIIIEPRWWELLWYLERLSPTLALHLAERNFRRLMSRLSRATKG